MLVEEVGYLCLVTVGDRGKWDDVALSIHQTGVVCLSIQKLKIPADKQTSFSQIIRKSQIFHQISCQVWPDVFVQVQVLWSSGLKLASWRSSWKAYINFTNIIKSPVGVSVSLLNKLTGVSPSALKALLSFLWYISTQNTKLHNTQCKVCFVTMTGLPVLDIWSITVHLDEL